MCWCSPNLRTPCCGGSDCHPPQGYTLSNDTILDEKVKDACNNVYVSSIINHPEYEHWHKRDNYTAHHTNGVGFVDYESAEKYCEDLPKLHLFMHDSGMLATHNIPCPVCLTKYAAFNTSEGRPEPCWDCQEKGYYIGKKVLSKWWEFWK